MAKKYVINETTLSSIGDAIRSKSGGSAPIETVDMATAIENLPTAEPFVVSGDARYAFAFPMQTNIPSNGLTVRHLINSCTTEDITDSRYMFQNNQMTSLPIVINFKDDPKAHQGYSHILGSNMFKNCLYLKNIPVMNDAVFSDCSHMFEACGQAQAIPSITFSGEYIWMDGMYYGCSSAGTIGNLKQPIGDTSLMIVKGGLQYLFYNCTCVVDLSHFFDDVNISFNPESNTVNYLFAECQRLRKLPSMDVINTIIHNWTGTNGSYGPYSSMFYNDRCLSEIRNLGVINSTISSGTSLFNKCLQNNYNLRSFTFETNEDGTPKTANFKGSTIDLTQYNGYGSGAWGLSNGFTADKEIKDANTYALLKNDPDAWVGNNNYAYSFYNHDSAVETIASLPDTHAYGTNTIKFKNICGGNTDGGAISTLTTEEIAVAAAKGWTVSLS